MSFSKEQIEQLEAKLSVKHVKTRKQAGRSLSYLEGWVAIAEANRIFGFDGWNRETIFCEEVSRVETTIGERKDSGWKVGYCAKVRVTVGDVVREGTGHGSASMRDLFECIESAAKEAETDAMKRALMTFGNPFGLALYDKDQRNVERAGGSYGDQADQRMADSVTQYEKKPLKADPDKFNEWVATFKRSIDRCQSSHDITALLANNRAMEKCKQVNPQVYEELMDYALGREQILATPAGERVELHETDAG